MGKNFIIEKSGIYHGDSDLLLPLLKPASVNLFLTDPPYNVTRDNNFTTMGRAGIEYEWDGEFDQVGWLPVAYEKLAPGGSMIIWNDWKNLGEITKALEALGMDIKDEIVWIKTNPWPKNTDRRYVRDKEFAFWAVKPKKWTFNKRPDASYERSEFFYPVQQHAWHPTKKPNDLFQELVEIHSNPGDLVVDPFAGAGTTAIAAYRAGRRHISFELRPDYFEGAVNDYNAGIAPAKLHHFHAPEVQAFKLKKTVA